MMIRLLLLVYFFSFFVPGFPTKPYSGTQRIFTDAQAIDFIDPAKHGFHIVLRDDFVESHLQPVHAPTVFASAIALQHSADNRPSPSANRSSSPAPSGNGLLRTTKTLYPENGNPDDGLLDGRTIKLLGLKEKTWYYVCVEFESNLRRHELVTGMNCQLKRTLDKFGQSVDSIVNEIELLETTDRSIGVRLTVGTDFPIFLHVYLNPDDGAPGATPPTQSFLIRPPIQNQNQQLRVFFGPFLHADTVYGKICVIEEPRVEIYTAMGRAIRTASENCYFNDLKTRPATKSVQGRKAQHDSPNSPQAQIRTHHVGLGRVLSSNSSAALSSSLLAMATVVLFFDFWSKMRFV